MKNPLFLTKNKGLFTKKTNDFLQSNIYKKERIRENFKYFIFLINPIKRSKYPSTIYIKQFQYSYYLSKHRR